MVITELMLNKCYFKIERTAIQELLILNLIFVTNQIKFHTHPELDFICLMPECKIEELSMISFSIESVFNDKNNDHDFDCAYYKTWQFIVAWSRAKTFLKYEKSDKKSTGEENGN